MKQKKIIIYSLVLLPSILFLIIGLFTGGIYIEKLKEHILDEKEQTKKSYVKYQESQSKSKLNKLLLLCENSDQKIELSIKKELKEKVDLAYRIAHDIKEKYRKKKRYKELKNRIKETLFELVYNREHNFIFVTDFNANSILSGSHLENDKIAEYLDYDNRSIVYEEIQKVRKYGDGYIKSRTLHGDNEIIYVKNLEMYKWYIGTSILVKDEEKKFKNKIVNRIKNLFLNRLDLIGIYENSRTLYKSAPLDILINELKKDGLVHTYQSDNKYYVYKYLNKLDWIISYGFDTTKRDKNAEIYYKRINEKLEKEFENYIMYLVFFFIGFASLSLYLYKKRVIFKTLIKDD